MVQVNNTPIVLRVKFFKVGSLQYISHLDLVRTMHKIVVRSRLPLWYTEGFNPKPKMVFAAPLSIGAESLCEFMDLRLSERIPPEEAMALLTKNLTDEMQVVSAYYPETKLAITEYNLADIANETTTGKSITAAIAETEALGAFALNEVYLATYWGTLPNCPYVESAINL